MNRSFAELERLAYIRGDVCAARQLALLDDAEASSSARAHIQEARAAYPSEDCLQAIIRHVQGLARSRVTKADMVELAGMLEELQTSIGHATGYGLEELDKAEAALPDVEG